MEATQQQTPTRLRCFLSYSRSDVSSLQSFCDGLRTHNIDPIFDTASSEPGADWQVRLLRLMRYCHYCIPLISLSSLISETCRWEWDEAERVGLRLFPAIVDGTPHEHLPGRFRRLHVVSISDAATADEAIGKIAKAMFANATWSQTLTELARLAEAAQSSGARLDESLAASWHLRDGCLTGDSLIRAEVWSRTRPEHVPNLPEPVSAYLMKSRKEDDARLARTMADACIQIMTQAYRNGQSRMALDSLLSLTAAMHRNTDAPCVPLDVRPKDLTYLIKSCVARSHGISLSVFKEVASLAFLPDTHAVVFDGTLPTGIDPRALAEWDLRTNEIRMIADKPSLRSSDADADYIASAEGHILRILDRNNPTAVTIIKMEWCEFFWSDGEKGGDWEYLQKIYLRSRSGQLLFGTDIGRVCLADLKTGEIIYDFRPDKKSHYHSTAIQVLRTDDAISRCSFLCIDSAFLCRIADDRIEQENRVDGAYSCSLSRCGQYWVVWTSPSRLQLHMLRDGSWHLHRELDLASEEVSHCLFSPGSHYFLVWHQSATLSVWSLPDLTPLSCLEGMRALHVGFSGRASELWMVGTDARLHILDLDNPRAHRTARRFEGDVVRFETRAETGLVSLISREADVRVLQVDRLVPAFYCAASSGLTDWAILSGFDGVSFICRDRLQFRSFSGATSHPLFDKCRRFVLIDESAGAAELLVEVSGRWRRARLLPGIAGTFLEGFAALPAGCRVIRLTKVLLATLSAEGQATIVSAKDGRVLFRLPEEVVSHASASNDGKFIIFGVKNGGVLCYETAGFRKSWNYRVRGNYVTSSEVGEITELAVTRDGRHVHVSYIYYEHPRPSIRWPQIDYQSDCCLLKISDGAAAFYEHTAIPRRQGKYLYLEGQSLLIGSIEDLRKRTADTILRCVDEELQGLVSDHDARLVAFFDQSYVVSVVGVTHGSILAQWDFPGRKIARLSFSTCARYLSVSFDDGGLEIFRIPSGISEDDDSAALLVRYALSGGGSIAMPLRDALISRDRGDRETKQHKGRLSIAGEFLGCFPPAMTSNLAPFELNGS